jgi:hypothetical protein
MTGEGGLLHDVGIVFLGRAKPMQEHNRRQDTVSVKGSDVQLDALHRQRNVRLSEGFGFGHVMDSLSEKVTGPQMLFTVASELARAGLRSGPKNQTTIADYCECCALKRELPRHRFCAGRPSISRGSGLL